MSATNGFEPQLIAFCCNFCAYAAALVETNASRGANLLKQVVVKST